jgi:CubicO group peptidase (beta-lactamase class C family)
MKTVAVVVLGAVLALVGVEAAWAQSPSASPAPAAKPWTIPTDAEIRQILVDRIDVQRQGVGMVVGIIDAHGRRFVSYGAMAKGDPRPVGPKTIFEIGSMSKVFTSLLLAEAVQRGEVSLDEPVAKLLPPGTKVPERGGKEITLIDLATHTSGLPRIPTNFAPKDPKNPYADYGPAQLYQFLAGYSLPRDIGSKYEYSNFGAGLLGFVMSRSAHTDYATLIQRRIAGPLGMGSTTVALSPEQRARLAKGYDITGEPASNWDLDALAGAGAIRSDAEDILTLLAAELGSVKTPLAVAMKAQLVPRRPTGSPSTEVALGWHITNFPGGRQIVWHDGGTGGYRSMMAFDPQAGVGVVTLSNRFTEAGVDDIPMHILTGVPLAPAPVAHHEVAVDPAAMQGLVGRYQLAPQVFVDVTFKDGKLWAQVTGQPAYPVFMEGPRQFFWKVVEASADFEVDAQGRATAMILHQAGQTARAPRVPAS